LKIVAIIQARLGSKRLPGKVLKKINGKPLLEYQVERLSRSKYIDQIVISTTKKEQDDPIIKFCNLRSISYFRGAEHNVLSRYYETAKQFDADPIVRLTSDCPIIDPKVVDKVIETYINHNYDYVSNTLKRTFPRGMDTEVFSYYALKKAHDEANQNYEKEHVTPYIYQNPSKFTLLNVEYQTDESLHRWTVDTEEDLLLMKKINSSLYKSSQPFTLEDILSLLAKHPEWKNINAHIEQKKLGESN
jgi:spore coat polysaccharide biosynthesis protein SpsF